MNEKPIVVDLSISTVKVEEISITYDDYIWIEDEFHPNGGSEQKVVKYREEPLTLALVYMTTESRYIEKGCSYMMFQAKTQVDCRAISDNLIYSEMNIKELSELNFKDSFELVMISRSFKQGE